MYRYLYHPQILLCEALDKPFIYDFELCEYCWYDAAWFLWYQHLNLGLLAMWLVIVGKDTSEQSSRGMLDGGGIPYLETFRQ